MPIVHSDRISGTIYVIASDAERAGDMALDYLANKTDASYGVFDERDDANKELYNKFSAYDADRDRVYAVSLDIRVADETGQ